MSRSISYQYQQIGGADFIVNNDWELLDSWIADINIWAIEGSSDR